MTILSFFTLNILITRLWTNLYHKEDHFLKTWPLLHYFSENLFKNLRFCSFFQRKIFAHSKQKRLLDSLFFCNFSRFSEFLSQDFLFCWVNSAFAVGSRNKTVKKIKRKRKAKKSTVGKKQTGKKWWNKRNNLDENIFIVFLIFVS